jgi:hypothetical protein
MHIIEYYSTLRIKEILSFATTWMNSEDIMPPSKINQTQKDIHCMTLLTCGTKKVKLVEAESRS